MNNETQIIPLAGHELIAPRRTAKLLWLSDEDPEDVDFGAGVDFQLDLQGDWQVVDLLGADPSTIFTRMPVHKPPDPTAIPRPPYYPIYAKLSPEQKWIYLNWLREVSGEIDIGYVFIYYYGLERHLLVGEYDLAFEEILFLRSHHRHYSFLVYSSSALLHSAIYRKRPEKLEYLSQSASTFWIRETELLLAYSLGLDFTAETVMGVARQVYGVDRRYFSKEPVEYKVALEEQLKKRYGEAIFPFASRYSLSSVPRKTHLMYANVSFPGEVRSPEIPDFLGYAAFTDEIREICAAAQESVKARIKARRR